VNGNTYLTEKLLQAEMGAGPAGRACAAKDANGCNIFGDFYSLIGWNWGRAWRFHAKAASLSATLCDGGSAAACNDLEGRYEDAKGEPLNPSKEATRYEKACDANVAEACTSLGNLYFWGIGVAKDQAKGAALEKKGCNLGSHLGCVMLQCLDD
jgi:hypothetical protein